MCDFEITSSNSEADGSDMELQEAFAAGIIKPGINIVATKTQFVNNTKGLYQKLKDVTLSLPWIERLDCINKEAPLAPELAAQMLEQEKKRENQLKNNKKLQQFAPSEDPVLNEFKREMIFHRQAQATVLEAIPKINKLGILTKRPDDYFAEMAKSDEHMQKIREKLMEKQVQQQRSEKVKQLRIQRKEGKALQIQTKLKRQREKKEMIEQVKKVKRGISTEMGFLDGKHSHKNFKNSKSMLDKRQMKDKKFGFGGKKRGMKMNTNESSSNFSEYKRPKKNQKVTGKGKSANKRPGKNRRAMSKAKGKK